MIRQLLFCASLACALIAGPVRASEATLRMVSIDMEGGGGTLFVTPEGRSLLIDTGSPSRSGVTYGLDGASSGVERIVAVARSLGLRRIDFLIITHYHADHIGGVFELLSRLAVGTIIDHGPNRDVPIPEEAPVTMARFPERSTPRRTSVEVEWKPKGVVTRFTKILYIRINL